MGMTGCTINGTLDDSKFNQPMPWIGLYVVAASAACSLAMAIDAFHGFRFRKYWFPCKFFALNATTLTLIAVAVKLSVDLNTSMPRPHDQLAKLTSTAFICTAIGNSMPSLGTKETKELMMDVVALGILVITVIVNICIQLGTGVIYQFWIEHAILIFLLVILYGILISSSLAISTTKSYLQPPICDGSFGNLYGFSYLMPWCFTFCQGESDYKWSTILILITQAIAVGVGTIAPASRWFIAIKFRCHKKMKKTVINEFSVEHYWIRTLCQLKEVPLNVRICGRHGRKFVHCLKNKVLDMCILYQKGTVLLSKFVRLISILPVSGFMIIGLFCKKLAILVKSNNANKNFDAGSESTKSGEMNLSNYVLHLEGEEGLIDIMMECQRTAPRHWFRIGRNKQPKNLIQLLEKLNNSKAFEGVQKFDKEEVPSLDSEEPANCWALPVATLDTKRDLINIRKAAEVVWVGVDLHDRWLDVDLHEMAAQEKSPKDIISELSDIAKQKFTELRKTDIIGSFRDSPSKWPVKVLATCRTLYQPSANRVQLKRERNVFVPLLFFSEKRKRF